MNERGLYVKIKTQYAKPGLCCVYISVKEHNQFDLLPTNLS